MGCVGEREALLLAVPNNGFPLRILACSPALPSLPYMPLGKSLNLSGSQFPHGQNGGYSNNPLTGILGITMT